MGRTSRWIRSLLGGKKESSLSGSEERREKKRWSFKSGRDSAEANGDRFVADAEDKAAWLRTVYSDGERQQNKHAIAVAAATAAAADAAVAAAQAAVATVRLTGQRQLAAVTIQTVFRGHLAKKALRALKALVKLQALVRGYLVRKQAAAMLHRMQALLRAQSTIRAQKCQWRFHPEIVHRKSSERYEETISQHFAPRISANVDCINNGYYYDRSPKIVEIDTWRSKSRSSQSRTMASVLDSAEEMTATSISSPSPCRVPGRISVPNYRNFQDYNWCRLSSTAQSTPRCMNPAGIAPATPAKSVGVGDPNCPNYMVNTRSFEAKVRSQSAPKQRPERPVGPRKRVPLNEVLLEPRTSSSGDAMQRSCTRVANRLDRSLELDRETEHEFYLQRK